MIQIWTFEKIGFMFLTRDIIPDEPLDPILILLPRSI